MELSGPKIKKVLIFREMELSNPKDKKFQEETFQASKIKKPHSKKFSYISGNFFKKRFFYKTKKLLYFFLYFRRELVKCGKQKFLQFFETFFSAFQDG